jgi:hypothetical protein
MSNIPSLKVDIQEKKNDSKAQSTSQINDIIVNTWYLLWCFLEFSSFQENQNFAI